jgi:hypothetical protein
LTDTPVVDHLRDEKDTTATVEAGYSRNLFMRAIKKKKRPFCGSMTRNCLSRKKKLSEAREGVGRSIGREDAIMMSAITLKKKKAKHRPGSPARF